MIIRVLEGHTLPGVGFKTLTEVSAAVPTRRLESWKRICHVIHRIDQRGRAKRSRGGSGIAGRGAVAILIGRVLVPRSLIVEIEAKATADDSLRVHDIGKANPRSEVPENMVELPFRVSIDAGIRYAAEEHVIDWQRGQRSSGN